MSSSHRFSAALLAALALPLAGCGKKAPTGTPTIPVSVAAAARTDVPLILSATGTVEPVRTVALQAQVSGILTKVAFREGQDVRQGQILFEIDPRPYRAAVDQAEANLARDVAQYDIARRDLERFGSLAAKEYVTQQQLDQTRANAAALAATLRGDSAQLDRAHLDLQYATIRAPLDGRAGAFLVREGNLVRSGSGDPLVVINQIAPILVRFSVPATYLDAVRRRADHALDVRAAPANDSSKSVVGTLVFLDNAVDSLTGTVALKASFPNTGNVLWPGALVRVGLQLDLERDVLVVPHAAIQSGQSGDMVWVVDTARTAHVRKVKVLRTTDTLAVLEAGVVAAGEQVVTDGQLRLTDGAKVAVRGGTGDTPPDGGTGGREGGRRGRGS